MKFKQLEEHEVLGCPRLQGERHIEAGQNGKQRIFYKKRLQGLHLPQMSA
jgi:hypothetical protein